MFFLLTFFFVPETKAKTVDTIYAELNAGRVWSKRRPGVQYLQNRADNNNPIASTTAYESLP